MNASRIHLRPALIAAAVLALGTCTQAQSFVYSAGHGDIGLAYDAGALELHGHLHAGALVDGVALGADEEYAPSGFTVLVPDPSIARPAGATWDFTGTVSGSPLWFLPQSQDASKPFLGIGSEELDPADWTGSLSITLNSVSGPGQFSVWQNGTFGDPSVRMSTADGISGADQLLLSAGGHAHYNFGFTAPGLYEVTFTASGVHAVDGTVSDTGTFVFAVQAVPEPSEYALVAGFAGVAFAAWRRRKAV
jgi:surface-anchored protein